ncbi:metal-dependent transcriptional regulator [Blastopirellula marina]|uniref:Transcriptional regulator MntR n=1 Tax=Blastopirellula marina TaxID=124 RepID=A0A2S8GQH4_9BACT|nr:metal-dependent transcriptional regulator [Blastopirellula marina]PQO46679.1 metal-dependent transcriptional regulator [Blastopirellula marina]
MHNLTIENYVKAIYQVCARADKDAASTGELAVALSVSPGTVTSMLKTLSEAGLAEYMKYEGVSLTPSGRTLALRVLRRHRLIELFLVRTLDLTWDEVHEEAEHMEHAVSDLLVDRIDEFLGHPDTDPHGDPIPRADGSMVSVDTKKLTKWDPAQPFRLIRVMDQTSDFLRYLTEESLAPGCEGKIVSFRAEAGVITIEVEGRQTTLGLDAAEKLLVSGVS